MSDQSNNSCKVCDKRGSPLSKCGGCKVTAYCSRECQTQDWPTHKRNCGVPWWDNTKIRRCDDGSLHEGELELVTWDTPENPEEDYSEAMGWGAVVKSEAEGFKQKFESELGADEKKLYKEWPQAFRWTCCGTGADMTYGCDHHGTGSRPCTCDFCKMGKPVTEKIYNNRLKSVHGKGLDLPRGPDPRSFNGQTAVTNAMARDLLGMDN